MTAPSSLSHPAKGLSLLPTPRGAAVSGNKNLKYAGLVLCVQELKLGCCSAVYLSQGSRNHTDVTQGRLHLGHFLCFLVQTENTVGKITPRKILVALSLVRQQVESKRQENSRGALLKTRA